MSKQNSPRWDAAFWGYSVNAASHLGLFCLHMSHKKDDRIIWVKNCLTRGSKTCFGHNARLTTMKLFFGSLDCKLVVLALKVRA